MTGQSLASIGLVASTATLAGVALGLCYFAALRRAVAAHLARAGWHTPLALTLGRMLGATAMFALAARFGAVALLASFVGFLLARTIVLGRLPREA